MSPIATRIGGSAERARPTMRSAVRLPRPEKISIAVISTEADTVALLSASV